MSHSKTTQEPSTSKPVLTSQEEIPSPPSPKSDRWVDSPAGAPEETSNAVFETKNGNLRLSLQINISFPVSDT